MGLVQLHRVLRCEERTAVSIVGVWAYAFGMGQLKVACCKLTAMMINNLCCSRASRPLTNGVRVRNCWKVGDVTIVTMVMV